MTCWMLGADLPSPPALERWLFEQPIPVAAGFVVLGAAMLVAMQRRGRLHAGAVMAAACALLSAAVFIGAMLITTTREELTERTRRWVARAVAADADGAGADLDDHIVLASGGEVIKAATKDDLLDVVRGMHAMKLHEWSQRARGAEADGGGGGGRTQVTVKAVTEITGDAPWYSTWEFTWRRSGASDWRITRLECLTVYGRAPQMSWYDQARRLLPRGPRPKGTDAD